MRKIKIAGGCLNQTPLDWKNNTNNIISAIKIAQKNKVAILCLPELAISGYGCEDAFFSDYVQQTALSCLLLIAEHANNIAVSVGLPLCFENCLFNVVAFIFDKKIIGFVAKNELAGDGIHYEPRWFKPWQENLITTFKWNNKEYPIGDIVFDIDGIRIGFEICEDAWNGIRPAQRHYLNNVDIILNPSASHFAFGKTATRIGIVCEASRSYSCTYVYSNLLGNEAGRVIYDGEILIAQNGNLIAQNKRFSFQNYQLTTAVIDIELPRRQKKKNFNFLPNLFPKLISINANIENNNEAISNTIEAAILSKNWEFYYAELLGLFDYLRKSKSKGFTISLSGGADSSICAVLAVKCLTHALDELGEIAFCEQLFHIKIKEGKPLLKQLVTCVYQATNNSSNETLKSAEQLAKNLGATFFNWNIQKQLDCYHELIELSIERKLSWDMDDISLQNIQARVRAPGIWMLANLNGALLLTTSNRSEAAVGYATMDGDTAGGLAPLGGIDKAFIIQWLKWAEKELNLEGLSYVNSLTPTAELRPSDKLQTDEKDLMPYAILNTIEKCAIRDYKSPVETYISLQGLYDNSLLKEYIRKFYRLWAQNQWKRERYAPSFHLDDENLDPKTWCRFPILSSGFDKELLELENDNEQKSPHLRA